MIPAPAGSGIIFTRTDVDPSVEIKACPENVGDTTLSTTLIANDVKVSTVEHLLSAIAGLGIDNLFVHLDGPEVPIMDGSSIKFVDLIDTTTIKSLNKKRKILKALRMQRILDS